MGDYAQKLHNVPQLFIPIVVGPKDSKARSESQCGRYNTNLHEITQCPKELIVQYETSEWNKQQGEREDKALRNKITVK